MKSSYYRFLMVAVWVFASFGVAAGVKDGLLFYAPFEGMAEAAFASGNDKCLTGNVTFTEGRIGKGISLEGVGKKLEFTHPGNYEIECGSVAFWVKPGPGGFTAKGNDVFFRGGHIVLALQGKRTFFMTGGNSDDKGFSWDYGLFKDGLNQWPAGQWQHIAITWSRSVGVKALYINGKKERETHCSKFPDKMGEPRLIIGENLNGCFDELMIWNRMLGADEIKSLATEPERVANMIGKNDNSAVADADKTLTSGIAAGNTLYLSFDNNSRPQNATGGQAPSGGEYAPGIVNHAYRGNAVPISREGNLDGAAGTIAFWLNSKTKFCELKSVERFIAADGMALAFIPNNRKLFFMSAKNINGKFAWDYDCWDDSLLNWNGNEWHHVAVTWNQATGTRNIYIDGRLRRVSASAPDKINNMKFGNASSYVDELMVWKRELSASEIAGLCAYPADVAAALGVKVTSANRETAAILKAVKYLKSAANAKSIEVEIVTCIPVKTVVSPGETFNAEVVFTNPSLTPFSGEINFILRDFNLNNCGESLSRISLAPGVRQKISVPCRATKRGPYKLEANWSVNGQKSTVDVSAFSCWKQNHAPDPDGFFGNHVNSWGNGMYLEQAAKLGENWERNHNMLQATWWDQVQPEQGAFDWTKSDRTLDVLRQQGFRVLGQLFTTPYWAAADGVKPPTRGYNPGWRPDAKAFDTYVFETVRHYKDYIQYWEVWNEPDVPMFWKGSAADYGTLVKQAAQALKRANPDAKVCGGTGGSAWTWLTKAAEAGALKDLDVFTFHHYYTPDIKAEELFKVLSARTTRFRELLGKYGKGKDTPLWHTEGNVGSSTFFQGVRFPQMPPEKFLVPTWREAAYVTVQYHAILMALGVKKYFIYLQNPIPHNDVGVYANISSIDFNNAVKPYIVARSALREMLDYTEFVKLIRYKNERVWAFVFKSTRSAETVMLLWCGEGGLIRLEASWPESKFARFDLFGNSVAGDMKTLELSEQPFYLKTAADPESVIRALENARITVTKKAQELQSTSEDNAPKIPADLPDFSWPSENPGALFQIDLRPYCNMGLADDVVGDGKGGWSDEGELNDMRDLKTGMRKFCGVPFELIAPENNHGKAVISLKGGSGKSLPEKVNGIAVGRKANYLYFLQSASWASAPNKFGKYIIHYQDGGTEALSIANPDNINDWWIGYTEKEQSRPAAVKVANTLDGTPGWRYLRVYEWRNPRNDVPIKSIDAVSYGSANIILLAITGL